MSASAADAIERAAGAVVVCLAFVVPPALAMDPCEVDLGSAPETKLSGSPLTWDLPAVGKWRVTRRDAGGRVSEGCGLGVIEAPLSAVRGVIDAAADFDQFMPRVLESDVEPVSPGVYLNRQILDMPFPVEDRRYTVRVETRAVETGAGAGWQARWTYIEGSGNVRESRGSWTLIPLDAERTVVAYRLLTDPGGRLPAWIVDYTAPRALRRVLASVRKRVLGRR
ncbi:MAG: hypothetical protein OYL92_04275 [Acidobacteriota bacterium]|nr:hypothetical protein [Acidobacteriota bacterium]MDE2924519.1 hypothetical protein [Acidobacteriota bacterium]MDE3264169.1 hypothetical protein [Acidobacteriota bacterium]